jgi:endonuclease III
LRRWPDTRLGRALRHLEKHGGACAAAFPRDVFGMALWEIVGYMADDAVRALCMEKLKERVGLRPEEILAAPLEVLEEITRGGGGIAYRERAERLREAAKLAQSGVVEGVCALPEKKAVGILKKFPMTGKPGAEKMLLFACGREVAALDSNGMRVVGRICGLDAGAAYAAGHAAACGALREELPGALFADAYLLLQRHGREVCRNKSPRCEVCPAHGECAFGAQFLAMR